jgi:acyl-CoA thioesterase FadM
MSWSYRRRVTWADVDLTGQWRFTAALAIVEEAETTLLREAALIDLVPRLPRVAVSVSYSRPATFDEELLVSFSSVSIGRSSIRYSFEIEGHGGICAAGDLVAVLTGRDGRPRRVPASVRRAMASVLGDNDPPLARETRT